MKRIIYAFLLLCLLSGVLRMPAQADPGTVTLAVYSYADESYLLEPVAVTFTAGDTPLSLLLRQKDLRVETSGQYVRSIGGLAEKQYSDCSGWVYRVDGQLNRYIGAGQYKLKAGQTVEWQYAVTAEQAGLTAPSSSAPPVGSGASSELSSAAGLPSSSGAASTAASFAAQDSSGEAPAPAGTSFVAETVSAGTGVSSGISAPASADVSPVIASAAGYLVKNPGNWTALALFRAGVTAPEEVRSALERELKTGDLSATDCERLLLNGLACGILDRQEAEALNQRIFDHSGMLAQGLNAPAFAVILGGLSLPVREDSRFQRDGLLEYLLSMQNGDGGFSLSSGLDSDIDITAMAVSALPFYPEDSESRAACQKALEFLLNRQNGDGTFGENGGNCESTAQVLIALASLGVSPADAGFDQSGGTLLSGLFTFQTDGGGFCHMRDGSADTMATEQAILALSAFREGKSPYCAEIPAADGSRTAAVAWWPFAAAGGAAAGCAITFFILHQRRKRNR